jgi:hypothetical protein
MTLTNTVIAVLKARGKASADDLLPHCPGLTRAQVMKALDNASYRKRIKRVGWTGNALRSLGIFVACESAEAEVYIEPPRGEYGHIGRVSSVFDLGARA